MADTTSESMASQLQLGNRALRERDFIGAIQHYLRALADSPALGNSIGNNLSMARRKLVEGRGARQRPSVAICGWELSHNSAGRVHTLANLYAQFADVEIIGSLFKGYGTSVWAPVAGTSFPIHTILVDDESLFIAQALQLVAAHPYDIVHLSKPRAATIFFGVLYQLVWGSRVLVDIDDEELAFVDAQAPIGIDDYLVEHGSLPALKALDGKDWTRLAVGMAAHFDGISVSNPALQRRYGGEIVRHARDERRYAPSPALRRQGRGRFGISEGKKVVLFCGTPREHKGLIETADAIAELGRQDVVFAIVGDFPEPQLKARLLERKGVQYSFIGNQPFESMPEVVAIGDICVLWPDDSSPASQFQVPAKLSDALGMGLRVISGLPAGVLDEPLRQVVIEASATSLADTLRAALLRDDRSEAQRQQAAAVFTSHLGLVANAATLRRLSSAPLPPSSGSSAGARLLQLLPRSVLPQGLRPLLGAQVAGADVGVSVVVLTLNAAPLLDRLLHTFFEVNSCLPVELIVIDHGSTDDTEAVVRRHAGRGNVRYINRGANFSFSESCNFGAEQAKYPHLLFLNNDIAYTADVLPVALARLADGGIGAVGVRLDDVPGSTLRPAAVQHTGIAFRWNESRQYHQPEQIRHATLEAAATVKGSVVPAVTGAFLLCRKADFFAVNGFSLDYHYGLEDIDLCLRLAKVLRKSSWCINELSLQHVEGATRNAVPGKLDEAIERNHAVFKRHWAELAESFATGKVPAASASVQAAPGVPGIEAAGSGVRARRSLAPVSQGDRDLLWTRCADLAPTASQPMLEMAGAALGLIPDSAALAGLHALLALSRLHSQPPGQAIRCVSVRGAAPLEATQPNRNLVLDPVAATQLSALAVLLADAWFTTDVRLRLRLEAQPGRSLAAAPCVVRCFQFDPARASLCLAAEAPADNDGPFFVDAALVNPYLPLLLTTTSPEGQWLGAVLLPFPSLCRGGMHHGELFVLGLWADYMANLQGVSTNLLTEFFGAAGAAPGFAISGLAVDMQAATGAEKIFTPAVKDWLAGVMQLGPLKSAAGAVADDAAVDRFLRETSLAPSLAGPSGAGAQSAVRAVPRRESALVLTLPADGLPTIGALVSRRLRLPEGGAAAVGSYLLAQGSTGKPLSLVSLPPMGDALLALQPKCEPVCFPVLRHSVPAAGHATDSQVALPLAIRFASPKRDFSASLLFPTAADHPGPLLRRGLSNAEWRAAAVSLLLCVQSDMASALALLESVARQSLAAAVDVVVALDPALAGERPALDALLTELFPARHVVVVVEGANRSEHLNRAAALAQGQYLLLADEAALLHDSRVLETLYTMMLGQRVASAGCVMLREVGFKKGNEVRFFSGGFYPSHLSFQLRPALIFNEPYTLNAFPNATYPVAGNSFRLALVSVAAWSALGGLDALNFPAHRQDLDFCLRAIKAGFSHLCTSAVTAADLRDGGAEEHTDTHGLGFMPVPDWQHLFSSVAVLKDIG